MDRNVRRAALAGACDRACGGCDGRMLRMHASVRARRDSALARDGGCSRSRHERTRCREAWPSLRNGNLAGRPMAPEQIAVPMPRLRDIPGQSRPGLDRLPGIGAPARAVRMLTAVPM
jgi:hypothetical protein